ncbi:hypothetical protein DFH09DRAFT_1173312 [Mycena vulgaris]|nr:hypothetical protein DFH09DRAFT_1173312 [Mycena vulgaris]
MNPGPHTHHFIHGIIIIIITITALSLGNCRFEGDSIVLSYLTSSVLYIRSISCWVAGWGAAKLIRSGSTCSLCSWA